MLTISQEKELPKKLSLNLTHTLSPVAMSYRVGHDGSVLGRIPGPRSTWRDST